MRTIREIILINEQGMLPIGAIASDGSYIMTPNATNGV
jgi:hypothetical protein